MTYDAVSFLNKNNFTNVIPFVIILVNSDSLSFYIFLGIYKIFVRE